MWTRQISAVFRIFLALFLLGAIAISIIFFFLSVKKSDHITTALAARRVVQAVGDSAVVFDFVYTLSAASRGCVVRAQVG